MRDVLFHLARPLLFALSGEQAHDLTLRALRSGIYPRQANNRHPELALRLWDLDFPNPIGIAAGFDKDARVPNAILKMGFGFSEAGTLTPKPQPGNPTPRVFRLIDEGGLINRLGFNNEGHESALQRLRTRPRRGIVGINIGANKSSTDRVKDYVKGLKSFYDVADYFMINISSPNTPGLRDLQGAEALDVLLKRLKRSRQDLIDGGAPLRPLIVKLSPDIAEHDLPEIIKCLVAHQIDGIAVSNTTLTRPNLEQHPQSTESGGLSGKPLFHRSTVMLARVFLLTEGKVPLVGIGGIDSGEAALAKIRAGASLLQLYTGLIYGGTGLILDMQNKLKAHVTGNDLNSITQVIGIDARDWAAKSLDG